MEKISIIDHAISTDNSSDIYSNAQENFLRYLKDTLEHKCYKGNYILEVLSIKLINPGRIFSLGSKSKTNIVMMIEASTINYEKGDVIVDCVITAKKDARGQPYFLGVSQYADCYIKSSQTNQFIKPDMIAPVIVGGASADHGNEKISATTTLFTPSRNFNVYIVEADHAEQTNSRKSNKNSAEKPLTDNIMRLINALDEKIKALDAETKARFGFFKTLLYPFDKEQKIADTSVAIDKILSIDDGYYGYDTRTNIEPVITKYKITNDKFDSPDANFLAKHAQVHKFVKRDAAIYALLCEYYRRVKIVYDFTIVYNTKEKISSHDKLWLLYKKVKLDQV